VYGAASQDWREGGMRWEWLPQYLPLLAQGLYITLLLLVISVVAGFLLAIPIGLAQVTGPKSLRDLAQGFCTFIRGTPLLVQLYLLYYGVGSLFPILGSAFPAFGENFTWLVRLDAFYYALLAFTLSFAGYEAEIMRGAFLGVPRSELEAARAFGMSPWKVLKRIWLPQAIRHVLPTLAGETINQLKATPLAFTIPVMDLMGVTSRIRQDTYLTYEPLLFLALVYIVLTFLITRAFNYFEGLVPSRR
jgi:polar amino acid transport system permease protein